VLVAFVAAITRKVLHAQRDRAVTGALADTIAIGLSVSHHGLVVIAKGARGDHRVAPVRVDVHYRCECPVASQGPRLPSTDQAHLPRGIGVGSRRGLQRRGDVRAIGAGTVAAGLNVRGH
jgi:hypothetical protein